MSGLDLTPKSVPTEPTSPLGKVKQNLKLPEVSAPSYAQNGVKPPPAKVQIQETTLPIPETTLFTPTTSQQAHRKKYLNCCIFKKKSHFRVVFSEPCQAKKCKGQ